MLAALNASLSGSKLVWGAAAIVASLGSRFIISELTPAQQSVLSSVAFKRLAIFAMLFLPTRDLLLSAALAVVVSVVLEGFANENSSICWLPSCARNVLPLRAPLFGLGTAPRPHPQQAHPQQAHPQQAHRPHISRIEDEEYIGDYITI